MTRVTTAAAEKVVEINFTDLKKLCFRVACSASTTLRVALNDAAELKGVKLDAAVLVGPNSQIALDATPESVFGDGLLDGDGNYVICIVDANAYKRFLELEKQQKQQLEAMCQRVEDEQREAEAEREARRSDFEDELTSTYHLQ